MIIHPRDEQALLRILRVATVPETVEEEYAIWIRQYHSTGMQGPIGELACVALVRKLGIGLASEPIDTHEVATSNWDRVVTDGTVAVKVLTDGQWRNGLFRGRVQGGTLAVKLEGEPTVREFAAYLVRPIAVDEVEVAVEKARERAGETPALYGDPPPESEGPDPSVGETLSGTDGMKAGQEVTVEQDGRKFKGLAVNSYVDGQGNVEILVRDVEGIEDSYPLSNVTPVKRGRGRPKKSE